MSNFQITLSGSERDCVIQALHSLVNDGTDTPSLTMVRQCLDAIQGQARVAPEPRNTQDPFHGQAHGQAVPTDAPGHAGSRPHVDDQDAKNRTADAIAHSWGGNARTEPPSFTLHFRDGAVRHVSVPAGGIVHFTWE